ncbi:hypothetical protein PHET_00470 [Paragonimus heterotremus]|uniref:HAT C-terminal dimerisation domain-containing protein n=1 Tax=Paragonimus heterotremus TaxID=100268 RepID=A0A8J4WM02_9TREM|nr:hypothetical protein PHET_00470 [Paragonimus heterotremus]
MNCFKPGFANLIHFIRENFVHYVVNRISAVFIRSIKNVECHENSKCPKPESSSPLIFAVDQLKISSDKQGHNSLTNGAEHWGKQSNENPSNPRQSPCGLWGNHRAQTKELFRVVPDRDGGFSLSEFHYKLAYFLIRDAHPPEVLQDYGFKTLILTLLMDKQGRTAEVNDFWVPSAWKMRHQILRGLCDAASERLEKLIKQQLHRTCSPIPDRQSATDTDSTSTTLCQTVAFTVELWSRNTLSPTVHSNDINQDELYADIGVHLPLYGTEEHRLFYCTRKVSSAFDLRSALRVFSQQLDVAPSKVHSDNIQLLTDHLVVTTNNSEMLTALNDGVSKNVAKDQTNLSIVPIPCLVTVLLNAIEETLHLPQVEQLMRSCQLFIREIQSDQEKQKVYKWNTEHTFLSSTSINEQSAHTNSDLVRSESTGATERNDIGLNRKPPFPNSVYSSVFRLLQTVDRIASSVPMGSNNMECAQTILHTLKPINRIINFLSHPHLFINAAMILPFLYSLRHHFDSAPPNHNTDSSCACKVFLQTLQQHLSDCYLKEGFVHEILLSATYLDPRFKRNLMYLDPNTVATTLAELFSSVLMDSKKQVLQPPDETQHGNQESGFLMERITKEMARFQKEPPVSLDINPFDWWRNTQHLYPTLAKTTFQFLNISPVCFNRPPHNDAQPHLSAQSKPSFASNLCSSNRSQSSVNEVTQLLHDVNICCDPPLYDQNGICSIRQSTIPTEDIPDYCFLWHNWMYTSPG